MSLDFLFLSLLNQRPLLYPFPYFSPFSSLPVGEADGKEDKSGQSQAKFSALAKFRNMDSKGTDESSELETSVQSTHQNAINNIYIVRGSVGDVSVFSTAGKDGKVVLWDMAEIAKLPNMKL